MSEPEKLRELMARFLEAQAALERRHAGEKRAAAREHDEAAARADQLAAQLRSGPDENTPPRSRRRGPRPPAAPSAAPSDLDRARARKELRRRGYGGKEY